jgi:nucleotide-binding universal stress UspA family protein
MRLAERAGTEAAMRTETWMVAHDFSPCSDTAVEEAARVVEKLGGKLTLLHVHPALVLRAEEAWGEETFNLEETLRSRLELIAASVKVRHPKVAVDVEVIPARDAAKGIVDEAKRLSVDHIVVGTHGRKGFNHFVLGSVAEKVAREAESPVTIVRAHDDTEH